MTTARPTIIAYLTRRYLCIGLICGALFYGGLACQTSTDPTPAPRATMTTHSDAPRFDVGTDTSPTTVIYEDDPRWDWRTMGSRTRGTCVQGTLMLEHADGSVTDTHPLRTSMGCEYLN